MNQTQATEIIKAGEVNHAAEVKETNMHHTVDIKEAKVYHATTIKGQSCAIQPGSNRLRHATLPIPVSCNKPTGKVSWH